MLYIIGLGIWDENDISLKGIEACRKCSEVFAELYTANWGGNLMELEKTIGKKIILLERSSLEENSEGFVLRAKNREIALLVPGDPLVATTHINLVLEAKKSGIPFRVIHSSSVCTAVAECGLGIYSFGKTATIAKPKKNYQPSSFYDAIKNNKKSGLHTLLLLDIGMDFKQGLDILLNIEKRKKNKILSKEKIIVASKIGSPEQKIRYGKIRDLAKERFDYPAVIIIPGKLHFLEKECLESK